MIRIRRTVHLILVMLSGLSVILAGSQAAAQGFWTTKAPMPTARGIPGVEEVNGILYALGGSPGTDSVEAYNPSTNSWTIKAPMPRPFGTMHAGVLNDLIYGADDISGQFEAYDPATDTWTAKESFQGRFGPGMGVANGTIYIVGGVTQSCGLARALLAYDPATDTWTTKGNVPTRRAEVGVGVLNGIMYVVGGRTGCESGPSLSTLEAYDPVTNTWTPKAPMPTARTRLGVEVLDGLLLAVGGNNGTQVLSTVEAYDPATNSWTTMAPMPTPRWGLDVGVVGNVAYAVGGIDSTGGSLATNEAFQTAAPSGCVGTGSFAISGTVRTPAPAPVAGVTMTLTGPGGCTNTTTTAAQGNYQFAMLANGTYTVTPMKAGCTFTPASRTVTISGANMRANFRASCT